MLFSVDEFSIWLLFFVLPAAIFVAIAIPIYRWSGRRGWFGPSIIAAAGLGFPLYISPVAWSSQWIVELILNPQGFLGGLGEMIALTVFTCGAIAGAGLYAATMSRLILGAALGASAISGGAFLFEADIPEWSIIVIYAFWHSAVLTALWWWSRNERIRRRADNGTCFKCGYDLAGLSGPVCPECGHTTRSGSADAGSDPQTVS